MPLSLVRDTDIDLGKIERGDTAQCTYIIRNTGVDTLRITSVKPSCGCTAALLDANVIPPSGSAHLKAEFHSASKEVAPFAKTITVLSNTNPKVLRFHGEVVLGSRPHTTAMTIQNIFSGKCAECHADRGRGQIGQSLYLADCAICHGDKSEGKPALNLLTSPKFLDSTYLFKTIQKGKRGTNMPGFDWQKGGPLTDQEIRTLCQYILIHRSKLLE